MLMPLLLQSLASGLLVPGMRVASKAGGPPTLKLSIPRDHPQADKILKLAHFLASKMVTDGGVEIERASPLEAQDAEDALLELLRDVVGHEEIDRALAEIKDYNREQRAQEFFQRTLGSLAGMHVGDALENAVRNSHHSHRSAMGEALCRLKAQAQDLKI